MEKLALHGGPKACKTPWPARGLFSQKEKRAVEALFARSIRTGEAFGYNGPEEEAYCDEFARFMGGGYADAVNSGTTAVYVALRALEVEAFTEVICPPVTDPGGVMPVPLCNCIPIPADAAPGSFNVGPDQIETRITPNTRAIIVAHVAGIPVEMGPIMETARSKGIPVIEDCAQAHGARYRGKFVGTLGDIAAFSTMFGKHHTTGGQGGIVFTKDKDLYWRARRYSDRGKPFNLPGETTHIVASLNCNLNELSACIGRVQLRKLPAIVRARRKSAEMLIHACKQRLKAFRILEAPPRTESSHWFLFGQLDLGKLGADKATFVNALGAEGVPCAPSYLHLFTDHEWYRKRAVFAGTEYPWTSPLYKGDADRVYETPNIRDLDKNTFTISWHERVTTAKVKEILAAIQKVESAFLKTER